VLTNNGSGGFVLSSTLAVGLGAWDVAAADVNGDGKVDLIGALFATNILSVLTNNGSGGFVLSSSPVVGTYPVSVAAADVNGDGNVDLISANYGDNTLSVLKNNGSGGFALASSPGVGPHPQSVAAGDVNGDGKVDLISANNGDNTLSVLFNTSDASFTGDGSGLHNLDASQLAAGTVSLARLPGAVVTNNATAVTLAGTFTGSGAGLTGVNADQLDGQHGAFYQNAANLTGTLADTRLSSNVALRDENNSFTSTNFFTSAVGIDCNNPGRILQVGNPYTYGSVGMIRLASHSTNSSESRVWDIGVPQTGNNTSGEGYCFVIDDTLLGPGPEFIVHWGNGYVGIGRTNPVSALDVNGTVTATGFAGNASGLTNLSASQLAGTVPLAQLPAVAVTNNATGVTLTGAFTGAFTGNGSGLTNLNASQFSSGTLPSSQLPVEVVTNNEAGVTLTGTFTGNGGGLTNVPGATPWQTVSGTSQTAAPNQAYLLTNNALVTLTLPATPGLGDVVRVSGVGSGGWKIAQNSGQNILAGNIPGNIGATWTQRERSRLWTCVASSDDGTKLAAGAQGVTGYIYTSSDSGATWTTNIAGGGARSWQCIASSANGTKLVAGANSGQIYTSTDSGATWNPHGISTNWWSVASSADGTKLVAAAGGGAGAGLIYTSTDSGANWNPRASSQWWRGVASSADGTRLVAVVGVAVPGQIYTSTDSGVTWNPTASSRAWSCVASSSDGSRLVAGVYGGQMYTSSDYGANWTGHGPTLSWVCVASSADGTKLAAAKDNGQIYTSSDSGETWTARTPNRAWNGLACSADGAKLVGVVGNNYIYTSIPSTTVGASGYLTGGQYSAVELQYIGNGQFVPLSHEGAISAY